MLDNYWSTFHVHTLIPRDTKVVVLHAESTAPLIPFIRRSFPESRVIYYCYQPPRELYDLWDVVKWDLSPLKRTLIRAGMPFIKRFDRYCVGKAEAVLCFSKEYLRFIRSIYGERNYRIVFAGVDFALFDDAGENRRSMFDRGEKDFVILVNAALSRKKNVDRLIELIAKCTSDEVRVRAVIIGEGPLREELESLARRRHVADRVLFAGYVKQEDLPHYYYSADALYYLEEAGAWTMSTIEAGAARIPVVAAPGGSLPLLVDHGRTGFLLSKSDDMDELQEYTLKLAHDRMLCRKMGVANYSHSKQFSLTDAVRAFLTIVADLETRDQTLVAS